MSRRLAFYDFDGTLVELAERPDAVVSTSFARADVPALETALSEAIARIRAAAVR